MSNTNITGNENGRKRRLTYEPAAIPQTLRSLPQWGVWRREYKDGNKQHVPYDAKSGNHLSTSNSETWSTFEVAYDAFLRGLRGQWDGISFVLTPETGIIGLDLDHCIAEDGTLTPEAQTIVSLWGSYLEHSPSQQGFRGFAYGKLPIGKRKDGDLEIYDTKVLTVTGWHVEGMPTGLVDRAAAIVEIHNTFFVTPAYSGNGHAEGGPSLSDEEVLSIAHHAKNGQQFQALLANEAEGYASRSEVDLALCNYLAFYCGPNSHEQMDRIIRKHYAGFRPKWDEKRRSDGATYGQLTIEKALVGQANFYHAKQNGWSNGVGDHEPLTEEEESAIEIAQEREEEEPVSSSAATIPCPDILRQGIFAQVAEKLGLWSWEVWHGTFAALNAKAQRNLCVHYYNDYLYGNGYSLLVAKTGAGKNMVVNVARALLGRDYKIRTGLNSGPALFGMLTNDSLAAKGGRLVVRGEPVLLLCSEWSRLAQMAGIDNATLHEDVNDLYMRHYDWTQSRSHRSANGGDMVVVRPTLTVAGTTTRILFHNALTTKALAGGSINRYLIVPGEAVYQPYTGQSYRPERQLAGLIDHLATHTFGGEEEIANFYTPETKEAVHEFERTFIVPIKENPETSGLFGRINLHPQHVMATYAWQAQTPRIEFPHWQAAEAITRIYHTFVTELFEEQRNTFEPTRVQEMEQAMERRAVANLKKYPGSTQREFSRRMSSGRNGYVAWTKTIAGLVKAGVVIVKRKGQRDEHFVLPGF